MKRGLLVLILVFAIFLSMINFMFLVSATMESDEVQCCCNVQGWTNPSGYQRGTCITANVGWVPKTGAEEACKENCLELCGDSCYDEISAIAFESQLAGAGCGIKEDPNDPDNWQEVCVPYCGNGYKSEGEECEEKSDCGTDSNVYCAGCKCRRTEICNGIDDDKDGMIDEDDSSICEERYLADLGDCPLDSACKIISPDEPPILAALGQVVKSITGRAEENGKKCEICKSVCKVCPPHPPRATKNNPLGICDPKKGYPFSKECIDYLNRVSCMTCDGTTAKARENDGTAGVNQNGDSIWSGTSFEKGTGKVIKDESSNALFPKYTREGGNNKDVLAEDTPQDYEDKSGDITSVGDIIDCALFAPIWYKTKKPLQDEENAWYGICKGMMCTSQECTSDCHEGYEKWVDKKGNKIEPKGPYVEKLTRMCSQDSYYKGYTNMKYSGSWGNLFNDKRGSKIPPNCYVDDIKGSGQCAYLVNKEYPNGRKLDQKITIEENRETCIFQFQKKAYYYIYLDALYNTYCACFEANAEFETQFAFLDSPNYEKYYSTTAALKDPLNSFITNPTEDNKFRLLNAVRKWTLG